MFARKVSLRLKTDAAGPFIQKMENEIIPVLRRHKGFRVFSRVASCTTLQRQPSSLPQA